MHSSSMSMSRARRSWPSRSCTSPRRKKGPSTRRRFPSAALAAEQIGDEVAPTDMHARTEVVAKHASTVPWNAQEHHKIFAQAGPQGYGFALAAARVGSCTLAKIAAVLVAIPCS